MAVKEDLQISFQEGNVNIEGLFDMGDVCPNLHKLNSHKDELRMAKYILQFVFLGFDGFRFPIAFFPSAGANAPELYINVWNMISAIAQYGFSIKYVCFDGGNSNRAFQMMHFKTRKMHLRITLPRLTHFYPVNVSLLLWIIHIISRKSEIIYILVGTMKFARGNLRSKTSL